MREFARSGKNLCGALKAPAAALIWGPVALCLALGAADKAWSWNSSGSSQADFRKVESLLREAGQKPGAIQREINQLRSVIPHLQNEIQRLRQLAAAKERELQSAKQQRQGQNARRQGGGIGERVKNAGKSVWGAINQPPPKGYKSWNEYHQKNRNYNDR